MMNSENNYRNSKTEFLFESDAEKVAIKEVEKKLRPKTYKYIIRNFTFISLIITSAFIYMTYYKTKDLNSLKGNIISSETAISKYTKYDKIFKTNKMKVYYTIFDKYNIIVNKKNYIDDDKLSNYKLVEVENNLYNKIKLEEKTYNNYLGLKKDLEKRGYKINITNGYISKRQAILMNVDKDEKDISKIYGFSEHNTGLAFDFNLNGNYNEDSDAYSYLKNIAFLYGFIIRYPKDKESVTGYKYSPFHLRYVGKDLAKYLTKNNLTLEEYYN